MLKNQNSPNKESIDPIDRMIESINKREELKSTMVEKTEKTDLFFKKYCSIYNYYNKKYPFQDPLTKVLEEINILENLITISVKENKIESVKGFNTKLKTLNQYAKLLAAGLDKLQMDVLFDENSYTVLDSVITRNY
tara:strand:+ start:116 stop:526 length:411 start_codon:yes stop_codon:yes gene_type:complete